MKPWQPTMTGPTEPERLDGQRVSAGYFRVLGVPPGDRPRLSGVRGPSAMARRS